MLISYINNVLTVFISFQDITEDQIHNILDQNLKQPTFSKRYYGTYSYSNYVRINFNMCFIFLQKATSTCGKVLSEPGINPVEILVAPSPKKRSHLLFCHYSCVYNLLVVSYSVRERFDWVYLQYLTIQFQGLDQTLCQLARCFYNAQLRNVHDHSR